MNDIILDQIDWIVTNNGNSNRLARQLISLIGVLADGALPDEIALQTLTLSRLVVLQDCFDELVKAFTSTECRLVPNNARPTVEQTDSLAMSTTSPIAEQIDQVRRQIAECEPVNFAQLISWVMGQARAKKLIRPTGKR